MKAVDPERPITKGNPPDPSGPAALYTPAEDAQHLETVHELWLQFATRAQIGKAMARDYPGITPYRVTEILKRVRESVTVLGDEDRKYARELSIGATKRTIARLESRIASIERENATPGARKQPVRSWYHLKLQYMRFLSDIEGTHAPVDVNINVNVDMSVNVQAVMATMTADQVAEVLEEERRRDSIIASIEPTSKALPAYSNGSAE